MALKKCKECGQEVSSDAKVCPHCGKKQGKVGCLGVLIIIFFVMVIIGIISQVAHQTNSTPAVTAGAPAKTVPAKPQWFYSEDTDKMRGQTSYLATMESTNKLDFAFPYSGGVNARIILRKHPKFGKDIMVRVDKGQFNCRIDGCTLSVKFDNNTIEKYQANEASDGSSDVVFISQYQRFLTRLKDAKHVIIESEFFNEGVHQMEFDVAGLVWDK